MIGERGYLGSGIFKIGEVVSKRERDVIIDRGRILLDPWPGVAATVLFSEEASVQAPGEGRGQHPLSYPGSGIPRGGEGSQGTPN